MESGAFGGGSLGPSIAGSVLNKSEPPPPPQPTKEDPDGPPSRIHGNESGAAAHGGGWDGWSTPALRRDAMLDVCARAPK